MAFASRERSSPPWPTRAERSRRTTSAHPQASTQPSHGTPDTRTHPATATSPGSPDTPHQCETTLRGLRMNRGSRPLPSAPSATPLELTALRWRTHKRESLNKGRRSIATTRGDRDQGRRETQRDQLRPEPQHLAEQERGGRGAALLLVVRSGRERRRRTLSRSSTRNESRPQLSFGDGPLLSSIDIRGRRAGDLRASSSEVDALAHGHGAIVGKSEIRGRVGGIVGHCEE